jgi:hypothetical protein
MKKKWLLLTVVVLLVAVSAMPALAGYNWCWNDPVVMLPNGNLVHVDVGVPDENSSQTVFMFIRAPVGSKLMDVNGDIPMHIFFSASDPHYRVTAVAYPSGMYPVSLRVSEGGTILAEKTGRPGAMVHVRARVH